MFEETILERIQEIPLTKKQIEAMMTLMDDETTEVLFGGAAGGGKSVIGCIYGIMMSLTYENIRGVMGRETLKDLKDSTLLRFFEICQTLGLKEDADYVYYTDSHILFPATNSTIYLTELKYYPSDPQYDYLGSKEYTWAFLEETQQISLKAKNVILSRLRYKLNEYGLIPKLLMTCNPAKGFLYSDFYKPHKEGTLPKGKRFIQSLPGDNPLLPQSYLDTLMSLDKQTRERQLYGNWDYDDDPAVLCEYDAIEDMFTNTIPPTEYEQQLIDKMRGYSPTDSVYISLQAQLKSLTKRYIIADIARFGDDRTVVTYWEGWTCKRIASYTKLPLVPDKNKPGVLSSAEIIEEWRQQYGVGLSNTIVDEDGVGGGPKDWLGCRGFVANKTPLKVNGKVPNYANLKAQCSYYLATKVNTRSIAIRTENAKIRTLLTEEMGYIKAKDRDKEGKLAVVSKDEIKKKLGRSPDFSDTLMMRAIFDLLAEPKITMIQT